MKKILEAGFTAGWIILLGIFLARLREFLLYWVVMDFIRGPLLFLRDQANSWFGYVVGVYLLLWLIGKWWMKYVWPWPSAPK